jgi:hypothetical protein
MHGEQFACADKISIKKEKVESLSIYVLESETYITDDIVTLWSTKFGSYVLVATKLTTSALLVLNKWSKVDKFRTPHKKI